MGISTFPYALLTLILSVGCLVFDQRVENCVADDPLICTRKLVLDLDFDLSLLYFSESLDLRLERIRFDGYSADVLCPLEFHLDFGSSLPPHLSYDVVPLLSSVPFQPFELVSKLPNPGQGLATCTTSESCFCCSKDWPPDNTPSLWRGEDIFGQSTDADYFTTQHCYICQNDSISSSDSSLPSLVDGFELSSVGDGIRDSFALNFSLVKLAYDSDAPQSELLLGDFFQLYAPDAFLEDWNSTVGVLLQDGIWLEFELDGTHWNASSSSSSVDVTLGDDLIWFVDAEETAFEFMMVVSRENVTLDGTECDLIGVSASAFANNQVNPCELPTGSCLQNQLSHFWETYPSQFVLNNDDPDSLYSGTFRIRREEGTLDWFREIPISLRLMISMDDDMDHIVVIDSDSVGPSISYVSVYRDPEDTLLTYRVVVAIQSFSEDDFDGTVVVGNCTSIVFSESKTIKSVDDVLLVEFVIVVGDGASVPVGETCFVTLKTLGGGVVVGVEEFGFETVLSSEYPDSSDPGAFNGFLLLGKCECVFAWPPVSFGEFWNSFGEYFVCSFSEYPCFQVKLVTCVSALIVICCVLLGIWCCFGCCCCCRYNRLSAASRERLSEMKVEKERLDFEREELLKKDRVRVEALQKGFEEQVGVTLSSLTTTRQKFTVTHSRRKLKTGEEGDGEIELPPALARELRDLADAAHMSSSDGDLFPDEETSSDRDHNSSFDSDSPHLSPVELDSDFDSGDTESTLDGVKSLKDKYAEQRRTSVGRHTRFRSTVETDRLAALEAVKSRNVVERALAVDTGRHRKVMTLTEFSQSEEASIDFRALKAQRRRVVATAEDSFHDEGDTQKKLERRNGGIVLESSSSELSDGLTSSDSSEEQFLRSMDEEQLRLVLATPIPDDELMPVPMSGVKLSMDSEGDSSDDRLLDALDTPGPATPASVRIFSPSIRSETGRVATAGASASAGGGAFLDVPVPAMDVGARPLETVGGEDGSSEELTLDSSSDDDPLDDDAYGPPITPPVELVEMEIEGEERFKPLELQLNLQRIDSSSGSDEDLLDSGSVSPTKENLHLIDSSEEDDLSFGLSDHSDHFDEFVEAGLVANPDAEVDMMEESDEATYADGFVWRKKGDVDKSESDSDVDAKENDLASAVDVDQPDLPPSGPILSSSRLAFEEFPCVKDHRCRLTCPRTPGVIWALAGTSQLFVVMKLPRSKAALVRVDGVKLHSLTKALVGQIFEAKFDVSSEIQSLEILSDWGEGFEPVVVFRRLQPEEEEEAAKPLVTSLTRPLPDGLQNQFVFVQYEDDDVDDIPIGEPERLAFLDDQKRLINQLKLGLFDDRLVNWRDEDPSDDFNLLSARFVPDSDVADLEEGELMNQSMFQDPSSSAQRQDRHSSDDEEWLFESSSEEDDEPPPPEDGKSHLHQETKVFLGFFGRRKKKKTIPFDPSMLAPLKLEEDPEVIERRRKRRKQLRKERLRQRRAAYEQRRLEEGMMSEDEILQLSRESSLCYLNVDCDSERGQMMLQVFTATLPLDVGEKFAVAGNLVCDAAGESYKFVILRDLMKQTFFYDLGSQSFQSVKSASQHCDDGVSIPSQYRAYNLPSLDFVRDVINVSPRSGFVVLNEG